MWVQYCSFDWHLREMKFYVVALQSGGCCVSGYKEAMSEKATICDLLPLCKTCQNQNWINSIYSQIFIILISRYFIWSFFLNWIWRKQVVCGETAVQTEFVITKMNSSCTQNGSNPFFPLKINSQCSYFACRKRRKLSMMSANSRSLISAKIRIESWSFDRAHWYSYHQ